MISRDYGRLANKSSLDTVPQHSALAHHCTVRAINRACEIPLSAGVAVHAYNNTGEIEAGISGVQG